MTIPPPSPLPPAYAPQEPSAPDLMETNRRPSFDMGLIQQHEQDEALARRLQAEEDAAQQHERQSRTRIQAQNQADFLSTADVSRTRSSSHSRASRSSSRTRTGMNHQPVQEQPVRVQIPYPTTPMPAATPAPVFAFRSDEAMARNLQQEMRDAEIARMIQLKEQEQLARRHGHRGGHGQNLRQTAPAGAGGGVGNSALVPPRRYCGGRRLCNAGIILLILGGGAFLVANYGSSIWKRLGGDPNDLPPFFHDNWGDGPNGNLTSGEFSEWRNKKNGLGLKIRNALTEDWDEYFDEAVNDWNASPALSLTTDNVAADPDCGMVRGIMKVCNKEYGMTGWTGLNEVYFEGDSIAASVAKMNESYLKSKGTTVAEKLFVMCHEIGHGFGLPHRDEIANNADLGSCLDYTYRFEKNMRPDTIIDFENLENLYGTVGDRRRRSMLRNNDSSESQTELQDKPLSFEKVAQSQSRRWHYREGRLLHQSKHKEIYENHLGNQVRVVTTLLLARDDQD